MLSGPPGCGALCPAFCARQDGSSAALRGRAKPAADWPRPSSVCPGCYVSAASFRHGSNEGFACWNDRILVSLLPDGQIMFFHRDIKGDRLPRGTVCFTYDDGPGVTEGDGPGPNTLELGRYLFEQEIAATFFVV